MVEPYISQEFAVPKLTSPLRNLALLATVMVLTTACSKDAALPWHYWVAPVIMLSVVGIVCFAMPVMYYLKVWRLKHRGR